MPTSSGGPAAAAVAGVEAAGAGQGLAAVDGAGAESGRRLQPVKEHGDEGPRQHSKQVKEHEGQITEENGGEGPTKHQSKINEAKLELSEEVDGCEGPNQASKHLANEVQPGIPQADGGEGPTKHQSKVNEAKLELSEEVDGCEGPNQASKVKEGDGEIAQEDGGEVPTKHQSKVVEGEEDEGEGPGQSSKNAMTGEASSTERGDRGKGPATPSPERGDRGKGPATPKGPVLWLGKGNLNRFKTLVTLTPDEEDDKLISILQDSGRVSREEFLKYNIVPDEVLANHSPRTRTAIHSLFRFLHESALIRRKMLHNRYKGLCQGSLEGSKRLSELRDDISAAQDEIKKSCGKVLRRTPGYLMSDPVLLPK